MTAVSLTCDRQDGLQRVALWQGRELRDLYLEKTGHPDMKGAEVYAKVDRLAAGQKAAWLDGGLDTMIYIDNPGAVQSGDMCRVRITAAARKDKAMCGVIVESSVREGKPGVIAAPPPLWQRAFMETGNAKLTALSFAQRIDYDACHDWLQRKMPHLVPALQPPGREPVHPDLDELIESLRQPKVNLPGGGNIVIEQTEALVAIDVNGGEAQNALAVNLQAAKEIARQIRLRNLSGIIVMDALKMSQRADKSKVLNALTRAVESDPAGVQVFGITKLGLIEMTRTRRGWSLGEVFTAGSLRAA